jgi:uncharacterized OsmC-like protein
VSFESDASQEDLNALQQETERRCPVYNLLKAANVNLVSHWERV